MAFLPFRGCRVYFYAARVSRCGKVWLRLSRAMRTRRKIAKISLDDPDMDIPPLTEEQLRSMRRATPEETESYRRAIENTLGVPRPPRMGRPPKRPEEKYRPVYMKLHPRVLNWARTLARKRGTGYQTVINETLLRHAA